MSIAKLRDFASTILQKDLAVFAANHTNPPLEAAGWCADLSRHYVDTEIAAELLAHADEIGLAAAIDALFSAKIVNPSEGRPALHWALRLPPDSETTAAEHQRTIKKNL